MFKIDYQLHGSPELYSQFCATRQEADVWMLANQDFLSFSHVYEVFH